MSIVKLNLHEIGDLSVWREIEAVAQDHVIPLYDLVEHGPGEAFFHDSVDIPPALTAVPVFGAFIQRDRTM